MEQKKIQDVDYDTLVAWWDEFSITNLDNKGLPLNTDTLPHIPYTYHEIFGEILRRDREEQEQSSND